LAARYFEILHKTTILEPEKRLILAILEDAIHCFQNNLFAQSVKSKRLFREAEEWIVEVGSDWVFSFENICETLGLDASYMRQGLLRWMIVHLGKQRSGQVIQKENKKKLTAYAMATSLSAGRAS